MAEITIVTLVHNPGKYIYPCVNSVLGQTLSDFEYVIIDNASSDGTKEVLEAYAEKDARIRLYRNEENNMGSVKTIETYVSTEYYMVLDHDDYLEPEALECLYSVAKENDLDMVFGRCEQMDANGNPLEESGIKMDIPCLLQEELWRWFDSLYWQMRTQWGKLIRTDLIKYIDMENLKKRQASKYAGDTVIILSMAFAAKRLGTVEKIVHHYRILDKSESKSYCRQRFLADWVVLDMARDLLRKQQGLIGRNDVYLLRVYYCAILDTLTMIMRGEVEPQEKIEALTEIVADEHTKEMREVLKIYVPEEEKVFVERFGQAVVSFYLKQAAASACKELVSCWLRLLWDEDAVPEREFAYLYEEQRAILLLLCLNQTGEAYKELEKKGCRIECPGLFLTVALHEEKQIKKMAQIIAEVGKLQPELYQRAERAIDILAEQNEIVKNTEQVVREEYPELVALICAEEYVEAANLCFTLLEDTKWQRSGGVLDLALTLVAILEDGEAFVFLEKCKCEFLIREGKVDAAKAVLAELTEMCPEDEEVKMLTELLG